MMAEVSAQTGATGIKDKVTRPKKSEEPQHIGKMKTNMDLFFAEKGEGKQNRPYVAVDVSDEKGEIVLPSGILSVIDDTWPQGASVVRVLLDTDRYAYVEVVAGANATFATPGGENIFFDFEEGKYYPHAEPLAQQNALSALPGNISFPEGLLTPSSTANQHSEPITPNIYLGFADFWKNIMVPEANAQLIPHPTPQ